MNLFLNYARSSELYKELCALPDTRDGNLLERTEDRTAEAQVEFLRWALLLARPNVIIETGTNKGLFGYLVSLLQIDAVIHSFDIAPMASRAAELLNRKQTKVRYVFYLGDSRANLPDLNVQADFAWVDGGHELEMVLSDLIHCYRLRVPFVAVDDTAYPSVKAGVDYLLTHTPYAIVENPFQDHDRRRALLLRLRENN